LYIYKNTSNSLTGATLVKQYDQTFSGNIVSIIETIGLVRSGNLTNINVSNYNSDFTSSSTSINSATFNVAVDNYLILAIGSVGGGGSVASNLIYFTYQA
jgi:uncharacterized protein YvpB